MLKEFEDLKGKTIVGITGEVGDEEMVFTLNNGERYRLYHDQDCCERVSIEDIAGHLGDLLNTPVLLAEEVTSEENPPGAAVGWQDDSFTWTFYKLSTIKGSATIRWYGESSGYYSEGVDFVKV